MSRPSDPPGLPADEQRRLAGALFNHVWTLLELDERTPEEDERMAHAAHASRYLWNAVGTAVHRARGDWQLARVYAVLGRPEPALHHARRMLALCEADDLGAFDLAYAHEALARAHAVAGDREEAERLARRAREIGAGIADDEERGLLLGDLETL